MIDWPKLIANSMWILGLALALATLSLASWQASLAGEKFRLRLENPSVQTWLDISGLLFCAGLAATSSRWWEIALWATLAVAFTVQAAAAFLAARRGLPNDSKKPS